VYWLSATGIRAHHLPADSQQHAPSFLPPRIKWLRTLIDRWQHVATIALKEREIKAQE
jgi:hypothetical protein